MKRFLTALLLVVANFFVMPPVDAEIQTYTGTDEYIVGEHETHEVAKNNSKIRAMRNAQDQAGVFIRSRSRMKDLELVDDEVVTLTEGILKIVGAPIHEIRLLGDGKGILIHTTITVEIDTDDLDRRLSEIARVHGTKKVPPQENISPPPDKTVDNIALSKQKADEAKKVRDEGRYNEAVVLFTQAIGLAPNNADFYNWRGNVYGDKLNDYDKAVADFTRAIEIDPNHKWAWRNRGLNHYRLGNYRQTVADCTKALEVNPNYPDAYNSRGRAYYELKKYDKALADYNKAIEINPNYKWSYNNRGNIYRERKLYDKALADYNKNIQLDPNDKYPYANRGRLYTATKDYWQALSDFDKAIKIDPKYSYAYWYRGKCYEAMGESNLARADFAKARQLGWKG